MTFDKADIARAAFAVVPITEGDWHLRLAQSKRGVIIANLANATLALSLAPEFHNVLAFDEFALSVVTKNPAPWQEKAGVWGDNDDRKLTVWFQNNGINIGVEVAGQAVQTAAMEARFHPVRDYLRGLKHDGQARLDSWLSTYCGASADDYTRAIALRFIVAAVARILRPGAKVDTSLILEGPQGIGKSSVGKTLFGDWFCDHLPDLGSKDAFIQLGGVWCVEVAEWDTLGRADASRVKAFLSSAIDRYRPPYGKRTIEAPRQVVFLGTVNHDAYLKDETGGRRFWPVKCGAIDLVALQQDRDQLWAEAVALFDGGARWWLDTDQLNEQANVEQAARLELDPWTDPICEWLERPQTKMDGTGHPIGPFTSDDGTVTAADVILHCVGKTSDRQSQVDLNRVARVLRSLGWERFQRNREGVRAWRYRKP